MVIIRIIIDKERRYSLHIMIYNKTKSNKIKYFLILSRSRWTYDELTKGIIGTL